MARHTRNFTVSLAQLSDENAVQDFLIANFYGDSPWHAAFGAYDKPSPQDCLTLSPDSRDFVVKAVDSGGNIIGVAHVQENYSNSWRDMSKIENRNLADLMDFASREAGLDKLTQPATELWILSVKSDWRGEGVASKLAKESVGAARQRGFKTMYICCVSEFSAKIARKLGWKEHYALAYKEYPSKSGKDVVLKPTPPHEHIYYYTTAL